MSLSPCFGRESKYWWILSNRTMVQRYIREAQKLIGSQEKIEISTAINLLDSALILSPRFELALELKARCFLRLRRFREVAEMLKEYIPSFKMQNEEPSTSLSSDILSSSQYFSKERIKLLSSDQCEKSFPLKCFSVSDLKRKFLPNIYKNCNKEEEWRFIVLGQACYNLGLMEDALLLLQNGKRLAIGNFRRSSKRYREDIFSETDPQMHPEVITHLLTTIKVLIRRRFAAIAALEAGHPLESIRHLSKILDSRRNIPTSYAANCYIHRASAYRGASRIAEAIADCNRTLALEPTSIEALTVRAELLETIRCIPDCLRDYEHLKMLYDTILRDRKLPGSVFRPQTLQYSEISRNLRKITVKIEELRELIVSGNGRDVDYYALIGVRRDCTKAELDRAHLLLYLKNRPEKSTTFVDRCEISDDKDIDSIKDQARVSALILFRLLQKGYSSIATSVAEKKKPLSISMENNKFMAAIEEKKRREISRDCRNPEIESKDNETVRRIEEQQGERAQYFTPPVELKPNPQSVFRGIFCRDLAIVGNLLSQVGFNRPLPVKYEALSC